MLDFQNVTQSNVGDLGFLHATVWKSTYRGLASDAFLEKFTPEKRTAVFRRVIETSDEHFTLAYLDGKAVGFVICKSTGQPKTGEICAIYLLKEVQHRGFGREMMEHAISTLRSEGCEQFTLWVLEKNHQARSFYEKVGFSFDGNRKEIDLGNRLYEIRYSFQAQTGLQDSSERRMIFDEDAALYDRWRPTYPTELFDDIIAYANLKTGQAAIEVGIGTGQATLPFLKTGCRVTAVEPGKNLAEFVTKKYAGYDALTVINKFFEDYKCPCGSFDLFYSATAFHWVPPELGYPKALRLLKSGGTLAVFWNRPFVNRSDDPLHREIQKIYDQYYPGGSRKPAKYETERYEKIKAQILGAGFANLDFRLYHSVRHFTSEEYVQLLNTYSDNRSLAPEIRQPFLRAIQRAIADHGDRLSVYDTAELYMAKKL